jgi:hypothetical protein
MVVLKNAFSPSAFLKRTTVATAGPGRPSQAYAHALALVKTLEDETLMY